MFKSSFEAFKRGGKGVLAMATPAQSKGMCVEHYRPRFAASPREFGQAMGYTLGCEGVRYNCQQLSWYVFLLKKDAN